MSGAEIANLKAKWSGGALIISDLSENAILTINPSTGGVKLANAGGLTISTGILGGLTVSTGILGGLTVSSGLTLDGLSTKTVTSAVTLTAADAGRRISCAVDGTFITLPVGGSTSILSGGNYTIYNAAAAGAAQIIVIAATGGAIVGAGVTTSNLLSNTKLTAKLGDSISLVNTGATTWYAVGMTGTWASTT